MDLPTVLARLNDLPSTFQRPVAPYTQLIDSIGLELAEFTVAADATSVQVAAFGNALDGWLNVWGLLWNVPRQQNESDSIYSIRIVRTVLAWVGTLPALQAWVNFYAPGGSVAENPSGLGYAITLPGSMPSSTIAAFIFSLSRIRPAGVPFTVSQTGIGIYLGTETFLGTGAPKGAYLASGLIPIPLTINPSTPNSVPLLPTLYFETPGLESPGLLGLGSQGTWPLTPPKPPPILPPSGPIPPPPPVPNDFFSNGGVLTLRNLLALPPSPIGLAAGAFWSDTGEMSIVPGLAPIASPPVFFGSISLATLVSLGSQILPTTPPMPGSLQLYNNGGVVCVA
jgi:hypothetical protein